MPDDINSTGLRYKKQASYTLWLRKIDDSSIIAYRTLIENDSRRFMADPKISNLQASKDSRVKV